MSHLYLSYHPADVDRLLEIHETLRQSNIADAFQTFAGTDSEFSDESRQLISKAGSFLLIASDESLNSKAVRKEFEFASERGIAIVVARLSNKPLNSWWARKLENLASFDLTPTPEVVPKDLISKLRDLYEARCPVVSVMNLKGGVGKTTVSSQVFGYLQKSRKNRILLIDFDPQFNLTQFFLSRMEADERIERDESVLSLFEPGLLTSSVHPSPALDWTRFNDGIFSPPGLNAITRPLIPEEDYAGALDLICGQFELTKYAFLDRPEYLEIAESNLRQTIDRYRKDYDLIVIDTNPSASFLTRVTLGVTDHILAPILPNEFSLRGLRLMDMILTRFCAPANRPDVSVLFNGVPKSQQNRFETDARDGMYDKDGGFPLSECLLENTLYQTAFLDLKTTTAQDKPVTRLAAYSAKGPFANDLRRRLGEIGNELFDRLKA